jgi:hypothetical protein
MPEAIAPAPVATPAAPAAAAPAPVRRAPAKASEYLAEVSKEAGTEGMSEARHTTTEPAKPTPKPDAEVESRITKLAGERRAVDAEKAALKADREKFAAEQAEALSDAATMKKLKGARTEGKVLEVLQLIGWTQDQIDTDVYNTLAKDILAREPGEPLTRRDVEQITEARVKAEREASEKKAETDKAAHEETVRANFLAGIDSQFDPAKYPALARHKATKTEVLNFVNEHYAAPETAGEVPTAQQIHEHFEALRRKDALEVAQLVGGQPAAAAATVPAMVGQRLNAGATPDGRDYSKLSRAERWELDKREAGIDAGS